MQSRRGSGSGGGAGDSAGSEGLQWELYRGGKAVNLVEEESYLENKHFGGLLYEALGMGMKKKMKRKLEVKKGQVSKEKVEGGASRPLRWFASCGWWAGQQKK